MSSPCACWSLRLHLRRIVLALPRCRSWSADGHGDAADINFEMQRHTDVLAEQFNHPSHRLHQPFSSQQINLLLPPQCLHNTTTQCHVRHHPTINVSIAITDSIPASTASGTNNLAADLKPAGEAATKFKVCLRKMRWAYLLSTTSI